MHCTREYGDEGVQDDKQWPMFVHPILKVREQKCTGGWNTLRSFYRIRPLGLIVWPI
jgi:hypothetical protein